MVIRAGLARELNLTPASRGRSHSIKSSEDQAVYLVPPQEAKPLSAKHGAKRLATKRERRLRAAKRRSL